MRASSFSSFNNLHTVNGNLTFNPFNLSELNFANLTTLGGNLSFSSNATLTSIILNHNLTSIGGNLHIQGTSIPLSSANTGVNLVGNPYPSPISIDALFDENPGIQQTLYFWRKRNDVGGSGYATCTRLGLASPQPDINVLDLDNTISTGQGFFVKTIGATALQFNNTMRSSQSSLFLRAGAPAERHRMWLNLSDNSNIIGQTLLGYAAGATQGADNGLDGLYFNESPIALTSLIQQDEYTVQARSLPFENTDEVPLGFKTNVSGNYSITLANFDGLFSQDQDIFLKDAANGLIHDLKASPYSFNTAAGVFNNRFSIVYQNAPLSVDNPDLIGNNVYVYKNEKQVHINAGSLTIDKVELFDIRGRLIYTLDTVNSHQAIITQLNIANQMLIVKVFSVEGPIITKKIIY